jgi:hypothetical protein
MITADDVGDLHRSARTPTDGVAMTEIKGWRYGSALDGDIGVAGVDAVASTGLGRITAD